MVNHKEILRLKSLGLTNREIAKGACCGRNTVTRTLARAREQGLSWQQAQSMSLQEVTQQLFPAEEAGSVYKMPDYEWVHREMQKSGATLSLLWVEYCEQCWGNGELPYKSTQFNKYYADYVHKTKATMHLEHKPGETMQVDWAGQTSALVDTDTGERLDAYLFVAVLPYSGYAYTEAFLDMKQEAWITGHVNAYRHFGGVTRILTPDNLKTDVLRNSRTETALNKAYQEMAEHYGTAILPTYGSMAVPTSTALWRNTYRRITRPTCNGTESDFCVGQSRSANIPPQWYGFSLPPTRWSSRATSPVWPF